MCAGSVGSGSLWGFCQLHQFSVLQDTRSSPESEAGWAGRGGVKRKEKV